MTGEERLPYRIMELATSLFAGEHGFSHDEIIRFFCSALNTHPDEVLDFPEGNRQQVFRGWLYKLPLLQQKKALLQLCREDIQMRNGRPPDEETEKLEKLLSGFAVDDSAAEAIGFVDSAWVADMWEKARERRDTDPDGAITAARALIESVCKHILDESGVDYDDDAKLPKLYRLIAEELDLAPNQQTEQVFRQVMGSCQSVVEGIGAIRNRLGDAHGKGKRGAKPEPRHAELAVNLAGSMASFLIATWEAQST